MEARRSGVITRKVGSSVTLACYSRLPRGVGADWYKMDPSSDTVVHPSKGLLINATRSERITIRSTRPSTLVIDNLQPSDSGLYLCEPRLSYLPMTVFNVSVTGG